MERLDELQRGRLYLWQDDQLCRFSADSLALVRFFRLKPWDKVLDLGAGSGILSILGAAKTGASFTGVDCQNRLSSLACRSAARNAQPIAFHTMDVSQAPSFFGHESFTAVVTNPPYERYGQESLNGNRVLTRCGTGNALEEFLQAAFLLLKNGGSLFICYPCDRLTDVMSNLRKNRMEPKRMRLVASLPADAPYLALIQAKKLSKPGLIMEKTEFLTGQS